MPPIIVQKKSNNVAAQIALLSPHEFNEEGLQNVLFALNVWSPKRFVRIECNNLDAAKKRKPETFCSHSIRKRKSERFMCARNSRVCGLDTHTWTPSPWCGIATFPPPKKCMCGRTIQRNAYLLDYLSRSGSLHPTLFVCLFLALFRASLCLLHNSEPGHQAQYFGASKFCNTVLL